MQQCMKNGKTIMNSKSEGMWDKVLMMYLIKSPGICPKVRKPNDTSQFPCRNLPIWVRYTITQRQLFNKCEFCILINVIEMAAGTFSDITVAPHSGRNTRISKLLFVTWLLWNFYKI